MRPEWNSTRFFQTQKATLSSEEFQEERAHHTLFAPEYFIKLVRDKERRPLLIQRGSRIQRENTVALPDDTFV